MACDRARKGYQWHVTVNLSRSGQRCLDSGFNTIAYEGTLTLCISALANGFEWC